MKELFGEDIFDMVECADAICIPTNCTIDYEENKYINPMGALAGAFAYRWADIPYIYAKLILMCGNVPCIVGYIDKLTNKFISIFDCQNLDELYYTAVVAYPSMYEISQPASFELVERSTILLVEMANQFEWKGIYTGAIGCGVGGLSYNNQVKPMLEKHMDDRFWVMQK
jgi:hypothetical protein